MSHGDAVLHTADPARLLDIVVDESTGTLALLVWMAFGPRSITEA
jgi:hypothetical protein